MKASEVKPLRIKMKLSQERFAAKVGVSRATIITWEKGEAHPSPLAQEKLEALEKELKDDQEKAV